MKKEAMDKDSLKRLIGGLLTAALIALNKRLGLGMTEVDVAALAAVAAAWLIQSGYKAAQKAKPPPPQPIVPVIPDVNVTAKTRTGV
jgi:hypothetical protein